MKSFCIIVVVIIFANVYGEDFLHTCPSGELLCGDRQKCVPTSALCNYVQDCDDLSDEINLKLCKKIRKHQSKCDPGMVACDDFTVHKNDTNMNENNNNNNDYYVTTDPWGVRVRRIRPTTTTTTTEAPKLSRYPFLSNQCLDVITACVIGKDCLGDDHISLCQKITGQKLSGLGTKIFSTSTDIEDMYTLLKEISEGMEDISNGTCPYFHTFFEGKCIWGLPIKTTWYEAKEICKSIGSELAVVKDFDSLRLIRNFIRTGPIGTNFWIGGNYMSSSDGSSGIWKWLDGSEVTNDLIFWAQRSSFINSSQNRPTNIQIGTHQFNGGSDGKCVAILSKNFYLFSDEDCNLRFSPLCVKEANTKEAIVREASTKETIVMEASSKEAIVKKVNITEANVEPLEVGDASFVYSEPSVNLEVGDASFVYSEPSVNLEVGDAPLQHQLPSGYVYL